MQLFHRKLPQLSFSENNTVSIDLPRNYPYHRIVCRLSGTFTIGTAAATALLDRNPLGIIKKLEIIANGKDTIKSLTGKDLYNISNVNWRTAPTLTPTGITVAGHAFVAEFTIDFARPSGKQPIDTLLNSAGLATFQLSVDWGDGEDIVTYDTTTTGAFTNTVIDLTAVESIGGGGNTKFLLNKEYPIEQEVSATASEFQIDLPVGNTYSRLLIQTTDAGVRQSDIINTISLQSGQEKFFVMKGADVQAQNKMMYQAESWPAGLYVVDFAPYGSLADVLNVSKANSLELVLDVTKGAGTTLVRVIPQEIIIPNA